MCIAKWQALVLDLLLRGQPAKAYRTKSLACFSLLSHVGGCVENWFTLFLIFLNKYAIIIYIGIVYYF